MILARTYAVLGILAESCKAHMCIMFVFLVYRKRAMLSSSGMKLGGAPSWLGPLLGARFFQRYAAHPRLAKNECNHYCLSCAGEENAVCCPMCLPGHRDHHVLQVFNIYKRITCVALAAAAL